MAHKTAADARRVRNKQTAGDLQQNADNMQGSAENNAVEPPPAEDLAEITGRFVGVDETDRAASNISKIHILKNRSSSEQNLMLKTSTLRKGKCLSSSYLYDGQTDPDKLNNNLIAKPLEINVTVSIGTNDCYKDELENDKIVLDGVVHADQSKDLEDAEDKDGEDIVDMIKAASAHPYKKNSNVYNVFQAKTVLLERRRSLPIIPKLIGQKLSEQGKALSRSVESAEPGLGNKDFKLKTFRTLSKGLGRLLKRHSSINISEPDPVYKVAYLGNVLTGWAKGEGCVDKPLATLWRNYNQSSKPDVVMKLSITNSGLKGVTKEHGLTEYWAHRITFCTSPPEFPKVFCWVYRHEGRKLKHELRCHAVLCSKESVSKKIASDLQFKIKQALFEFKRDKLSRQNARLSLANSVYDNPSMPRRKILLSVGGNNYKPPLERSKSAPKLMAIEEMCSEEDEEESTMNEDRSTNTWTKDSSALKACYKPEDIFPSYTLGRRKFDRKFSRKNLPDKTKRPGKCEALENSKKSKEDQVGIAPCESLNSNELSEDSNETCDDVFPYSSRVANSTNHVSFSLSTVSNSSENNHQLCSDSLSEDTEDEVFYCETDERLTHLTESHEPNDNESSMKDMDQLCTKANFLVLDSDEGSISSGCETASTVTTSDIEMTSLPCTLNNNEFQPETEKISVLERVQSFEQLFSRERNNSNRNFRSGSKRRFSYNCGSFRTPDISETNYSSPNDSLSYSPSIDSGAVSCSDEVNLVPIGEKQSGIDIRRPYIRCATYPPSDDEANVSSFDSHEFDSQETLDADVCETPERQSIDFDNETKEEAKAEGDSDSACSVESGYSEFSDGGQHDCVIGNTVCV